MPKVCEENAKIWMIEGGIWVRVKGQRARFSSGSDILVTMSSLPFVASFFVCIVKFQSRGWWVGRLSIVRAPNCKGGAGGRGR